MSRTKNIVKSALSFFALLAILVLSACSFAPVYSDQAASNASFNLAFERGTTRLEQIVYADLVAHFGRGAGQNLKNVQIIVSSSAINPGNGSVGLKGVITVTNSTGETLFTGTRTASATYIKSAQSLANQQAANEASERAAHELAQTIRLTLIGVLSSSPNQ